MKINIRGKQIDFKKEQNKLDNFVIEFTSLLNDFHIFYVIVSGYVPILFGRNRTSEDVDIIVEKIDFDIFRKLWQNISFGFYCINTKNGNEAFEDYLCRGIPLRFARKIRLFQISS